jgi:hypothetical protein
MMFVKALTLAVLTALPGYRVTGDVVAAQTCIAQAIFAPGDTVIFRARVQTNDGAAIGAKEIAARGIRAIVTLRDGTAVKLAFYPPDKNHVVADAFWSGAWHVAKTHSTGTFPWRLTVTDRAGGKVEFTPIGQSMGLSVLTIAHRAAGKPA